MSSRIWDGPCPTCGKYSLDCTCGLFYSKENESMESHQERKELYELSSIRDESLHVQPYADMIDKLTYVQKADFAKRALELERDCVTYKKMFEEVSRERNAWISEYRAAREEVERLKQERKQIIETNASIMLDRDRFHTEVKRLKNEILKSADQEDFVNTTAHADASEITSLRRDLNEYTTLYREFKDRYEFTLGRANALEEWLSEYRDDLKKGNVFHKNQGIINAINELLNEND